MAANSAFQTGFNMIAGRNKKDDDQTQQPALKKGKGKKGKGTPDTGSQVQGQVKQQGFQMPNVQNPFAQYAQPKASNFQMPSFQMPNFKMPVASPPAYKKGGRVKRTGLALVHKGERVIPAKRRSMMGKAAHKRSIVKL